MAPLRVGMIGTGGIARTHATDYYSKSPAEAQLVAIAEPDAAARERFADLFGVRQTFADAADLLALGEIDVVDICTPPEPRPHLIRAAARAGKHVLCEKPLALDYAECAAAIEVAERAGVQVGVMQNYRWRPEYIDAAALIANGRLGRPFMATLQALYHWHGGKNYRREAERMLMLEVGYHYVDLLRFVLGSDVTRVYAAAGRPSNALARGDTFAALILHFENGAIGSIVNSGECQGATVNWGGSAVIQAEEGTVYINHERPLTLEVYSSGGGGRQLKDYPRELVQHGYERTLRPSAASLLSGPAGRARVSGDWQEQPEQSGDHPGGIRIGRDIAAGRARQVRVRRVRPHTLVVARGVEL